MSHPTTRSLCLTHLRRGRTLAVICAALIAGCGSPKMAPIPRKTVGEFACRTSSDGFEVAVDPWMDRDRVKKHFGMDLLSRHIVPFEVVFANVGAEGGFLLQPELLVLLDDKGRQGTESASGKIAPSGRDPAAFMVTYLAISQVLAVGLAALAEEGYQDTQDVRRQMDSLQFTDRPLYRSDSNRGFIYLRFADLTDLANAAAIRFRVKNVRSRQEKTLVVLLKEG
jgi:hypothetical protein